MTRRLLNFLTALSLLLCVAVVALYARSYFRSDCLTYTRLKLEPAAYRVFAVIGVSGRGNAWASLDWSKRGYDEPDELRPKAGWQHESKQSEDVSEFFDHRAWGFGYDMGVSDLEARALPDFHPDFHRRAAAFPLWAAAAAFAVIPATRLVHGLRRRRRAVAGVCSRCGYDLRATPDRCPECGNAAKAPA